MDYIGCEQFLVIYARRYGDFDIAAFTATTNAFYYTAEYAKEIKKRFAGVITVCGGTHPTLYPDEVFYSDEHKTCAITFRNIAQGTYLPFP